MSKIAHDRMRTVRVCLISVEIGIGSSDGGGASSGIYGNTPIDNVLPPSNKVYDPSEIFGTGWKTIEIG
jgi:hypothetical protein